MFKNKWYEWILIFFPIVLALSLGVFCGALGGALAGGFGALGAICNAITLRSNMNIYLRILSTIIIGLAVVFAWALVFSLIAGGFALAFPWLVK